MSRSYSTSLYEDVQCMVIIKEQLMRHDKNKAKFSAATNCDQPICYQREYNAR